MAEPFISIVIPNRNGALTLDACLAAATSQRYPGYEVIVVDDASTDDSAEIISRYNVRLISLDPHGGAAKARNTGARAAQGHVLFFIDADCVLRDNTLWLVSSLYTQHPDAIVGGTYTPLPYDSGIYSTFQSLFIHYSETRHDPPDYVATHAMIMDRQRFLDSGGFNEDASLPILEDVEYCHRMRQMGVQLKMHKDLQVRHIFNFTLARSLANAFKKARHWTAYSLQARDLHRSSGTSSLELKTNVMAWALTMPTLAIYVSTNSDMALVLALAAQTANFAINRDFMRLIKQHCNWPMAMAVALYYVCIYPPAVAAGGMAGLLKRP